MVLTLEVVSATGSERGIGARCTLDESGGVIGRDKQSHLVLPDSKVSKRHANVTCDNGVFYIEDNRSTNGTFVNSRTNRLTPGRTYPLRSGDTVFIDPFEIRASIAESDHAYGGSLLGATGDLGARPSHAMESADPFAISGGWFPAGAPSGTPLEPEGAPVGEVDPLVLLGGPAPASAPSAPPRAPDPEFASPLSSHYAPPPVYAPPAAPAPAAPIIPADYNPLADEADDILDWSSPPVPAPAPAPPPPPPPVLSAPPVPAASREVVPPSHDVPAGDLPLAAPEASPAAGLSTSDFSDLLAPAPEPVADPSPPAAAPVTPPPAVAIPPVAVPPAAPAPGPRAVATPRSRPTPPPVATPGTGQDAEAPLQALLAAAGLPHAAVTPGLATDLGVIFRTVVAGVMDVLRSRQEIKDEFRMRMTQFRPVDNNPLKLSVNVDDALHNLLVKQNPAFMSPPEAFEDAFEDLRNHQLAMLAGMRVAFEFMLAEFAPERLERQLERGRAAGGWAGSLGLGPKQWEAYREHYAELLADGDGTFRRLFGEHFSRAYEEQMQRLRLERGGGARGGRDGR